jgi:uncharacterized membrane protein YoaK (UPF0700 family)
MEPVKGITQSSILLSIIAGFCDTITFVAASELFSAHVTGNFILFAYDLIRHADSKYWIKLITFPVFIFSIIIGGWFAGKAKHKFAILVAEGCILSIAGLVALLFRFDGNTLTWPTYTVAMLIVFAMGFQNVFGKVYSQETFGPTTMMTGNVTKAALDLYSAIKAGFVDPVINTSLQHQLIIIGGFLVGCILGAIAGELTGLSGVLLPGMILVIYAGTKK